MRQSISTNEWKRFLGVLVTYVAAIAVTGFVVMPAMAFNCHSLAWHDGWGDWNDSNNYWYKPWWDDCPCDDMQTAVRVASPLPGDIVLYGNDVDGDGLECGEILHSGRYLGADWAISKLGFGPIMCHPVARCLPEYGSDREYWRKRFD